MSELRTLTLWHGGNLDTETTGKPAGSASTRWEYGPGLYLTTHYSTALKYSKGSRKLYRITIAQGRDASEVQVSRADIQVFVKTWVSTPKRRDIDSMLRDRDAVPASTFITIMVNAGAITSRSKQAFRDFLTDHGVDYEIVDNAFGWRERMVVLYNFDLIVKKEVIRGNMKIDTYDQPREWNMDNPNLTDYTKKGDHNAETTTSPTRGLPGRRDLPGSPSFLGSPLREAVREPDGSLAGLPRKAGAFTASHYPHARQIAEEYMASKGWPYNPPNTYSHVVPERATRIAAAFDAMKHDPHNTEVASAYADLVRETLDQYNAIVRHGYTFEFYPDTGEDPYHNNPREMTEDVRNNHHMYVFPTDTGFGYEKENIYKDNPLLAETAIKWGGKPTCVNDIFRVVHDFFGHVHEGLGFRHHGEENAWRAHSAMFSPNARRALTTETRGQNSWVNFGPYGEHNQKANQGDTHYADQKIGLLPDWAVQEGAGDEDLIHERTHLRLDMGPVVTALWKEMNVATKISKIPYLGVSYYLSRENKKFKLLGEGSSRAGYLSLEHPDFVIKTALNPSGLDQNAMEARISETGSDVVPHVFAQGKGDTFLIVEYVNPISQMYEFWELMGYHSTEGQNKLQRYLIMQEAIRDGDEKHAQSIKADITPFKVTPLLQQLADLILHHGLEARDFRTANCGKVERDGEWYPVLLDPGLHEQVAEMNWRGTKAAPSKFDDPTMEESLTWSGHRLSYRTSYLGMPISVENRKGSIRRGTDSDGNKWETKMTWPYGYIRGTVGVDKDHVDCFLGPNRDSTRVFVVHQIDTSTGEYDEDKVMLGWDSEEAATEAYLSNYNRSDMFGSIEMLTLDEFKDLAFNHKGRKITLQKEDTDPLNERATNVYDLEGMLGIYVDILLDKMELLYAQVLRQIPADPLEEDSGRKMRSPQMFNANEELSPRIIKATENIIRRVKAIPLSGEFYQISAAMPSYIRAYFASIFYNEIQGLTVGRVVDRIRQSNGEYSLWYQLYDGCVEKHHGVLEGTDSIDVEYEHVSKGKVIAERQTYTVGQGGITLNAYMKKFGAPQNLDPSLHLNLKTGVAEEIGFQYIISDFGLTQKSRKAVIAHPNGSDDFPDFLIDTELLDRESRAQVQKYLMLNPSRYIFVDTKAPTQVMQMGRGNERLQFYRAERINAGARQLGILPPGQELLSTEGPEEIQLTAQQLMKVVKIFMGGTEPPPSAATRMDTWKRKMDYINAPGFNLVYHNVGRDASSHPPYYLADIRDGETYTLKRANDFYWKVLNSQGSLVASITFYVGAARLELSKRAQEDPRIAAFLDRMSAEEKMKESEEPQPQNYSHAVRAFLPFDRWIFMFRWNTAGLLKVVPPVPDKGVTQETFYANMEAMYEEKGMVYPRITFDETVAKGNYRFYGDARGGMAFQELRPGLHLMKWIYGKGLAVQEKLFEAFETLGDSCVFFETSDAELAMFFETLGMQSLQKEGGFLLGNRQFFQEAIKTIPEGSTEWNRVSLILR